VHASEFANPKGLAKFCRNGLRSPADKPEEVRISSNPAVKHIFKFKLDSKSDQKTSGVYIPGFLQKPNKSHLADHCTIGVALADGDGDAKNIAPVATHSFDSVRIRGCSYGRVFKRWLPNEVFCWRLPSIGGNDFYNRLNFQQATIKSTRETNKENIGVSNIDVSPDLGFSNTSGLRAGILGGLYGLPQSACLPTTDNDQGESKKRDRSGEGGIRISPNFLQPAFFWLLAGTSIVAGFFGSQVFGWALWDRGRRVFGIAFLLGGFCFGAGGIFILFCWPIIGHWLGI